MSTSCLGMSISSLWKTPLSMTHCSVPVSGSEARMERLWSSTSDSAIASVSGIEKEPWGAVE